MKIKISKNNLFDKNNILSFKKRFFSENSKLMKYRRFYNLNLLSNHIFYNNFFFFLKKLEQNLIYFTFLKNNLYKYNISPSFLFNKQIFFDYKNFLNFSRKNKINFLYSNNFNLKNFGYDFYGNNFILSSNKNIDQKTLISLKNEYNIDIFYKNDFNLLNKDSFLIISYFINFNLFISNISEFYKILILLQINNLYKIN